MWSQFPEQSGLVAWMLDSESESLTRQGYRKSHATCGGHCEQHTLPEVEDLHGTETLANIFNVI